MDNDEHGIERYWAGLEADLKATGCIPQHVTYLKSYFLLGAVAGLSMAGTNLRAIKAAFPDAKTVDAMVGCVALMRNRVEALALHEAAEMDNCKCDQLNPTKGTGRIHEQEYRPAGQGSASDGRHAGHAD